ncbi:hypothetical protein Ade02nite_89560 [Paractinoplanes deccanensis]|uniref:Uncharacterized protein n=1 Tax=Paractinoplanes deccanensis TaxID=113561 RepID=A0ABQ3YJY5_9ACTN|nr:hypothetical protein Ade02nite_89560 [Actinoplanes deccanensis]
MATSFAAMPESTNTILGAAVARVPKLALVLDVGELPDVAVDECLHISVEEAPSATSIVPRRRLRQTATDDPGGVVGARHGRLVP